MDVETQRFVEENSVPIPWTGCWIWVGAWGANGYGAFIKNFPRNGTKRHIQSIAAHRMSFHAFHGEIPHGMLICHRCDVRPCVNPAHLYAGTLSQNRRDMLSRGAATGTHYRKEL